MHIRFAIVFSLTAGLTAGYLARRLPARGWAALVLCTLPPLGLYYLFGSC